MERTNNPTATAGFDSTRISGEWTTHTIHSRGPGILSSRAGGSARNASVTGPPSTSRTGTNILSVMCAPILTLNIAEPYAARPELVATSNARHPVIQAMV